MRGIARFIYTSVIDLIHLFYVITTSMEDHFHALKPGHGEVVMFDRLTTANMNRCDAIYTTLSIRHRTQETVEESYLL